MSSLNSKCFETIKTLPEIVQKKEVVIFRLSAMGDIALLTGVLRYWYEEFGLRFIVISRSSFLDLFKNHPAVIECYPLEKEDLQGKAYREKCKELALKYANYPLFDMHASTRSRVLASFWKNKVLRYNKFPIYRRVFLWTKGKFGSKKLLEHNVCQRYASLLSKNNISREDLIPQIYLSEQEIEISKVRLLNLFYTFELFNENLKSDGNTGLENLNTPTSNVLANAHSNILANMPMKKIIALHPFATHLSKTLSMQSWLSLAEKLSQEFGKTHEILWVGIGELPSDFKGKSLVNQTSLRELCSVLYHCDILITGDSGPMHLANGVNCKLLALFGPTCEEWGFYPVGINVSKDLGINVSKDVSKDAGTDVSTDVGKGADTNTRASVKIIQKNFPCKPCSLHGAKTCSQNGACMLAITDEEIIEHTKELVNI